MNSSFEISLINVFLENILDIITHIEKVLLVRYSKVMWQGLWNYEFHGNISATFDIYLLWLQFVFHHIFSLFSKFIHSIILTAIKYDIVDEAETHTVLPKYICAYHELTHWPLGDLCQILDIFFKLILVVDGWGISCKIFPRWMPHDFTNDKSALVQVMACCHQATSHCLSQCWPIYILPYGITRPQCVNNYPVQQEIDWEQHLWSQVAQKGNWKMTTFLNMVSYFGLDMQCGQPHLSGGNMNLAAN